MFILFNLWGGIVKILYIIMAFIDYCVYGIAAACFDLIRNIYEYSFFGAASGLIDNIRTNIYIVLGVLMMFKIILSAIQYMINPDTFDDKEKGMVGILKNAIITVLLIAFMPVVFDFAMDIQADVVATIPNIILGDSVEITYPEYDENGTPKTDSNGNTVYQATKTISREDLDATSGKAVAYAILRSFVSVSSNTENHKTPSTGDKDWNAGHRATKVGPFRITINKNNSSVPKDCANENVVDERCYEETYYNFDEIHDLASFKAHVADGMENGWDKGEYDYMILISTAAGVFLVYILLSMSLDVAIRTIKLGIIQMLAPIPISSYMFKKDNFNKFIKISGKVYADLFVRMAIIYIVILAVQVLINSGILNIFRDTSGGDWMLDILRNVILIFGLFMFAKSAPKFVTDLIGLPDVTGGDIADMFKPAWQRAGGAAGALINPARNAVSNVRKAWQNNADMVDSRGGKLRRFMQKTRRVGNAARHGVGGLARGTIDSFAGAAAGDDWNKMNERHKKSTAESVRRSAEGYMKRTSNDERQAALDKRKEIAKDLRENYGIDLEEELSKARRTARASVQTEKDGLDSKIKTLRHNLAMGIGDKATNESELQTALKRQQELSTKKGFDEAVKSKVESEQALIMQNAINHKMRDNDQRRKTVQNRIMEVAGELHHNRSLSQQQRENYELELYNLRQEKAKLDATLDPSKKTDVENEMRATLKKAFTGYQEEIPQRDISGGSIIKGRIDEFFGGEGFTGKGYTDVADTLSRNREALWQKEAMSKLSQAPDILGTDDNFHLKSTTLSYAANIKGEDGHGKLTYSKMFDLYSQVSDGTLDNAGRDTILNKWGFKNIGDFKAAFKDIEKQAATEYVRIANTNDGRIDNPTIVEGIKRMTALIASANIPRDEKRALLRELNENPGKFLQGASSLQERLRTKGSRINAYNSGTKDN